MGTFVGVGTHERLLDGLNHAQVRAVVSEAEPLCVLAGAGSGKTRVLTRRIAWRAAQGNASLSHVLALTFTRKAAGELRDRLSGLGLKGGVAAGTFHAVALAQLRRHWADAGVQPPTLIERKAHVLAPLLGTGRGHVPGRCSMAASSSRSRSPQSRPARAGGEVSPGLPPLGSQDGAEVASLVASVATEIEWAKARLVSPSSYASAASSSARSCPLPPDEIADVYRRYEDHKCRARMIDFDDLLLLCANAMEGDGGFAAAQRWRFRHLFVDEFQDVNPAQYRLLRLWLGERRDLCVVGDPHQAIYSWNGADPSLLANFSSIFPSAEVLSLDDNYRSTPQVLAAASCVLPPSDRQRLRANRPDGPVPSVTTFDSDVEEARGIARRLRACHGPGVTWSGMAVLARTNAALVGIAGELRSRGIPYRIAKGSSVLDRPEVRAALSALKQAPPRRPFGARLKDLPLEELSLGAPPGEAEEARLALDSLLALGREYESCDHEPTVEGFIGFLQVSAGSDTGADTDAVELSTFHRAKGLEWPVVFVAALEHGLVPIGHANSPAAEAEERRLLYVAMSRAERQLHCSWAERRRFGDRTVHRRPSPYLDALEATCRGLSRGPGPAEALALLSVERDRLAQLRRRRPSVRAAEAAERADPDMLESLRSWRASAARASGVPAYVILHDATIAALATSRPSTEEELASVPGMGPVKVARHGAALLALISSEGTPA